MRTEFNFSSYEYDEDQSSPVGTVTRTTYSDMLSGHEGILEDVRRFLEANGFRVDRLVAEVDSEHFGLIRHCSDGFGPDIAGQDGDWSDYQASADAAFNDGYDNGYNDGFSDGYEDAQAEARIGQVGVPF